MFRAPAARKPNTQPSAPHHTDNLKTKAPNATGSDHLYNTLELLMMGIMVPETCWASNKICDKYHLLHLVGILFPHINDDAGQNHIKFSISGVWTFMIATQNVTHLCGNQHEERSDACIVIFMC